MSSSTGIFQEAFSSKEVSKYIFANEKKIYNEIKYVTEIKYVNFVNWVRWKIKSISGLLNTNKDKKNTFVVGRMTQYMLIRACIYIVVPQQKYLQN